MKFFRTPYFVLLFLIRFLIYLYRRFRRRSTSHLSLLGSMYWVSLPPTGTEERGT
jgi:flagellar biogenesis protein FliO